MDFEVLSRELLRSLRGKRSQTQLSRRLGFRSNVLYTWESGRRQPSAAEFFRLMERTGADPRSGFATFALHLPTQPLSDPEGITGLLAALRGGVRINDLAERTGRSRFTISRWLRGKAQPNLPQLLQLIEVLSLRLVDFLTAIAPSPLPSLRQAQEELDARRDVAFTHPWSQAVLRLLETERYRKLPRHRRGWIARHLGISVDEEARCIEALQSAALIHREKGRFVTKAIAVDTSTATLAQRQSLKLHWADLGRQRIVDRADGYYSWSIMALSQRDFEQLRANHVRYMQSMRQIVDASTPSEVVAVANVQLFSLGNPAPLGAAPQTTAPGNAAPGAASR